MSAIGWHRRRVVLGQHSYPYFYGYECADRIVSALAEYNADRFFVVTDDTVRALHGDDLLPLLARHSRVHVLSQPAGEGMKTLASLVNHLESAIAAGATRRSVVVAFGGGVPGNLAGALAGLLFRGVRLVHVPTTTVAAMDSVISLKQAVNSAQGKNLIGTYHIPEAVYLDVRLLQTLPHRELRSGLCEAAKNCLAIRPAAVPELRRRIIREPLTSPAALLWLLQESLAAKLEVTIEDAREQRVALILEYGHTVGHAVELCDQRLRGADGVSHGEAVAFGMAVAARVSAAMGGLDAADVALHDELIRELGAPPGLPAGIGVSDVMAMVRLDNKRGYLELAKAEAAMVLLRRVGVPFGPREQPLVAVPFGLVHDVLAEMEGQVGRPVAQERLNALKNGSEGT